MYVTLLCDTTEVFLGIDVTPNLGAFSNWNQAFPPRTAPRDVRIVNRRVDSANEGFACDYGNAVLSAIPRLTSGCSVGEPGANPLA